MRQPFNVLVIIFRRREAGAQYAVFRRSDDGHWQPVCGGVEEGESLAAAARREMEEETGMPSHRPIYKLDIVSGVAKSCFEASKLWPASLYVVQKHFFATESAEDKEAVVLSHEHREMRWLSFEESYSILRYDDEKTALWELEERLRRDDLPEPL